MSKKKPINGVSNKLKVGDKIKWKSSGKIWRGEIVGFNESKSAVRPVIVKPSEYHRNNITLSVKACLRKNT